MVVIMRNEKVNKRSLTIAGMAVMLLTITLIIRITTNPNR